MTATRGTSNRNERGSSEDRRRRRAWLVETFRANVDVQPGSQFLNVTNAVPCGEGIPVCRCYRCGLLLTASTVTVDRIIPGAHGGTYRRNNIRPACADCNSETGGAIRSHARKAS